MSILSSVFLLVEDTFSSESQPLYRFFISSTNLCFSLIDRSYSSFFRLSSFITLISFRRSSSILLRLALKLVLFSSEFDSLRILPTFLDVVIGGLYFSIGDLKWLWGGLLTMEVWLTVFCWFSPLSSSERSSQSSDSLSFLELFLILLAWKLALTCETMENELCICCLRCWF